MDRRYLVHYLPASWCYAFHKYNVFSAFIATYHEKNLYFRPLPLHVKVLNYEIIVVGVMGLLAGTFAAVQTLVQNSTLVPPCYVNMTAADQIVN